MDEAERCHKLAYIAYGQLLARGTAREVIDSLGLSTWSVTGDNLVELAERLRGAPGVAQTVAFGTALNVSGPDEAALRATLTQLAQAEAALRIERIDTKLEDAFIYLMGRTSENDAAPAGGRG
jgi:ABC-2 type transport system ATP-binding protein